MAAGCVFSLAALLSLAGALGHSHQGAEDTYEVSAGHFFLLKCGSSGGGTNVTWSRGGRGSRSLSLPSGVEVRQGALWFLPLEVSHNGTYTCRFTCEEREFMVSVSRRQCPPPAESRSVALGASNLLPCRQKELFGLNSTTHVRWLKDCRPLEPRGSISRQGDMRLPATAEEDAGIYTCLVEITLDGRNYTAAHSFHLRISEDPVLYEPSVVYPTQKKVVVELGSRVDLECFAYLGVSEDSETLMYWIVNGNHSENYKQLDASWKYIQEGSKVFGLSILSISEVLPGFLEVPILCVVENPVGRDDGVVWLQEADHSALHTSVALCLASSLGLLAVAAGFLFFKVDLVLAYRKLCPRLAKQTADGKLYDAYVSFLHADGLSSSETETFALQVLPEVLEKQHGYSLYIRGRDDCPGEAVHDVIAAAVRRSRRLIIVLSATSSTDAKMEEASAIRCSQNQLCYEQRVGLYDALTQSDLRVILVETGGPVDYSGLPESLRYIKKKQGALKWRTASPGKHKLSRLSSNRLFWKSLRYHMPSVPAGRRLSIV